MAAETVAAAGGGTAGGGRLPVRFGLGRAGHEAPALTSGHIPDPPVVAKHAAGHRPVGLGRLQRAQAAGPHQDHLVITPATGVMDPGHPGPPGAVALMPFPGEQVPGHAARQLDERRRPRCPGPRHDSSMRNCVRCGLETRQPPQESGLVPRSVTRRTRGAAPTAPADPSTPYPWLPLRGLSLCETGAGARYARIKTRGHRAGSRSVESWAGRTAHRQRCRC